tara:strand:- start:500 stop:805 length:306 start_codon:yes stop_codon:yes gene_type:complete
MQKYLSILVKNEQRQLALITDVAIVEQASTTAVDIIYTSGKKVTVNHDAMAANNEEVRDAIEDALITALGTAWTSPSFNLSLNGINDAGGDQVEVTSLAFS